MTRRLEITVSEETWAALERARGHEPRASFVKRALESALGGLSSEDESPGGASGGRGGSLPSSSSVSSRAPVRKGPNLPRRADTLPGDTLPASGKPSLRDTWSR